MQNRAPDPLLTWMLCGLAVLITVANTTSSPSATDLWSHIGHCTDATPSDIWNGHYYFLISSVFLHSNFMQGLGVTHLIFDVYWMFRMGSVLESTIGTLYYFLFFLAAAFVSSCAELLVTGSTGIGLSGVVYAVFGLLWAGRGRYPEWGEMASPANIRLFISWGILCFILTALHLLAVGNWAHTGGLAFGYGVGLAFFVPRHRWIGVASVVALVGLTVLSLTYMPWSADWTFWKGNKAFDADNYARAIYWYNKSLKDGVDPEPAWENIASSWHNQAIIDAQKQDLKKAAADLDLEKLAEAHITQAPTL